VTRATIEERGNGLADVGDYVAGDDGEVYIVDKLIGPIHTNGCGPQYIHADLSLADWTDVDDDTDPRCGAVLEIDADEARRS
jgi:hypothetical protein